MKLKIVLIIILLFILAGCGGVPIINTSPHIPNVDTEQIGDSNYAQGWKLLKEGDSSMALKLFQQSSVEKDKLFVAYGYTFMAQNDFDLARRNFNKAITFNPENLKARMGIASLHELLDQNEKAFSLYSRLLAENPDSAWLKVRYEYIKSTQTEKYLQKAETYKISNKTYDFIEALKQAAEYSPEIQEIKMEIADFYNEKGQYEKAAREYEAVREKAPHQEDLLVKLAGVYEKSDQVDAALMVYRSLLEIKPEDLDLMNKVNELKIKFYESDLPTKFKNIFFKKTVSREDVAALLGFYFDKYLTDANPIIIRDITTSFAKEYIIRLCSLKIMRVRPDYSFDRYGKVDRAAFAVALDSLIQYLEKDGYTIKITPQEVMIDPADVSPLHKNYKIIKYLVNAQIMKLDDEENFNSTRDIAPDDVMAAIRKLLNNLIPN